MHTRIHIHSWVLSDNGGSGGSELPVNCIMSESRHLISSFVNKVQV